MEKLECNCRSGSFVLGFFGWLGGAVYVAHQPGMNFWDGVIWLYYSVVTPPSISLHSDRKR